MVAPLLLMLGLGGLAAAGGAGRNFLDDYLARRSNERQAGGFMAALDAARGGTGAEQVRDPGDPYGPQPEQQGYDLGILGRELLAQGNPAGLQYALAPQQAAAAAASDAADFRQQMGLEQFKQQQQNARMQAKLQQDLQIAQLKAAGQIPAGMITPDSSQGAALLDQADMVRRVGQNIARFRELVAQAPFLESSALGTEVASLRGETMALLSTAAQQGVIREGELPIWEARVPNVGSFVGQVTGSTTGGLNALSDWYNAQAGLIENRARFAMPGMIDPFQRFPSRLTPPPGTSAVTTDQIERREPDVERRAGELQALMPAEAREGSARERSAQQLRLTGPRPRNPETKRPYSIEELMQMSDDEIEALAAR